MHPAFLLHGSPICHDAPQIVAYIQDPTNSCGGSSTGEGQKTCGVGQSANVAKISWRRRVSFCELQKCRRQSTSVQHASRSWGCPPVLAKPRLRAAAEHEGNGRGRETADTPGNSAASDWVKEAEKLFQLAAGTTAATEIEERESTRLLKAAEAALGLWRRGGRSGHEDNSDQGVKNSAAKSDTRNADEEALLSREEAREVVRRSLGQLEDAQELLQLLQELNDAPSVGDKGGKGHSLQLAPEDVAWLLDASLTQRNAELAKSILEACKGGARASTVGAPDGSTRGPKQGRSGALPWPAADVDMYSSYILGLASLLRVSDAVSAVREVRRRGLPAGDEVPFGSLVGCPTCQRPLNVVQPQYGRQVVPCSRCLYRFELISGDLVSCDSESLLEGPTVLDRVLRFVRLRRKGPPTALHSLVVRLPDGTSQIRTFATSTPSVPAQQGERITLTCAAPADFRAGAFAGLRVGGSARSPGWRAGEPMQLTNHGTGEVLPLLRAPPKSAQGLAAPAWALPVALFVAANAAAGSAIIDPNLPALIGGIALSGAAASAAVTTVVAPQLNRLPAGSVVATSVRQQLLDQYSALEKRLDSLTLAAGEEVRMLARLCQLQNKMEAVGEPSTYGARLERVLGAREGLEQRLRARLQLIDSYAKIAAMIEIEVEMESDVAAAEAAGAAASIADQIERLMEVESLQKEWRIQAEANEDVERLLRSAPPLPD